MLKFRVSLYAWVVTFRRGVAVLWMFSLTRSGGSHPHTQHYGLARCYLVRLFLCYLASQS